MPDPKPLDKPATAGMLILVMQRDDPESEVQRLLDELCVKLGFCLPPEEARLLRRSPPTDVDGFTDAVFDAEGLGDMRRTNLHDQVRAVVDQHMSRWLRMRDGSC
jgi:hypothetical protein